LPAGRVFGYSVFPGIIYVTVLNSLLNSLLSILCPMHVG